MEARNSWKELKLGSRVMREELGACGEGPDGRRVRVHEHRRGCRRRGRAAAPMRLAAPGRRGPLVPPGQLVLVVAVLPGLELLLVLRRRAVVPEDPLERVPPDAHRRLVRQLRLRLVHRPDPHAPEHRLQAQLRREPPLPLPYTN